MGIALPKWIVESQNNVYVLGFYGLLFGGALPLLVGRWWFGNRQKTKDGVNAKSAAGFFKGVPEEGSVHDVVGVVGKAFEWEGPSSLSKGNAGLEEVEKKVEASSVGEEFKTVKKLARNVDGKLTPRRWRGLVLLFAHLGRVDVGSEELKKEQREVVLSAPVLLNALLNVVSARNWLHITLTVMRLNATLVQALPLTPSPRALLTQLPGLELEDVESLGASDLKGVLAALEKKEDARAGTVRKALEKWGRVEIVDAGFKVIGESVVTPSSIIFLVVKLRLVPPVSKNGKDVAEKEETVEEAKRNAVKDEEFLVGKAEAEELDEERAVESKGLAHAPRWPGARKAGWWLVLGDEKQGRVVVPPSKISEIPFKSGEGERDYRSFKIQFQGPPATGVFTWKVFVVSDTFVGEEVSKDVTVSFLLLFLILSGDTHEAF